MKPEGTNTLDKMGKVKDFQDVSNQSNGFTTLLQEKKIILLK